MGQYFSTAATTETVIKHCENWLSRGEEAYGNGSLSEAESCYTSGIDCVPENEESEDCLNVLASCYSNRAMVRMLSGKNRAALGDCERAANLNPNFQKDQVTAGSCHLALGEINEALQFFEDSLPDDSQLCLDRQLVIQATDGLRNAKKARDYLDQCDALLQRRLSSCAESALRIIAEALLISPFSEKLLERKAKAFLMLMKYEETIELCDESLDDPVSANGSGSSENCFSRVWRGDLKAMSFFHLGRLEDSLALVEKLEQIDYSSQKFQGRTPESLGAFAATVRELLRHRAEGIKAFKSGRHSEAIEHYNSALACTSCSRPFAAICLYDRAASHQALGRTREALRDCKKAAEMDPSSRDIQTRAACHLALGELEEALKYYKRSLQQDSDKCLDSDQVIEASKGLQKVQQASEYLKKCAELLRRRTSADAVSALQTISEALLISPLSENLIEMKAEALLMLDEYEETIQLCEKSLDSFNKSSLESADGSENLIACLARLWRWRLMAKSFFYLGMLEETLNLSDKLDRAKSFTKGLGNNTPESLGTLAATVRQLLFHKASAIEASKLGRYSEEVKHYTSALTLNQKSQPFAAFCFSGRAAALQALGKMRAALEDCKRATDIDPQLQESHVRAGNCHLALGEIHDAIQYFNNSLSQGSVLYLDRKLRIEADNGLVKAQEAVNFLDRCDELLLQRTTTGAERALKIIDKALSVSPYSEKLVERKANALLMLRHYEEMIQLCEQSLDAADKNCYYSMSFDSSETKTNHPARVWRWCLMAKGYFYLGRLEQALSFFEKLEQATSGKEKFRSKSHDAAATFAVTVRELLAHKNSGNEAFRLGRHLDAVEHYTSALSCNLESRPFSAICLYNRAAANQALGQITDAVADCSLAIALAGNYPKAVFKRAILHEMVKDYRSAISDLERLISDKKSNQSGRLAKSTCGVIDLGEARSRLTTVKEMAKKGIRLDMYLILGLKPSCVASDITSAYRKAALRHHPDKVSLSLSRNGNLDNAVWKEIAAVVNKDANLLFKTIGEANSVLSDRVQRSRYDEVARAEQ